MKFGKSLKLKQEWWALFKANRTNRRAVFLGMPLQAMQHHRHEHHYAHAAHFKMAGFTTTEQQMIATLVVGPDFYVRDVYRRRLYGR